MFFSKSSLSILATLLFLCAINGFQQAASFDICTEIKEDFHDAQNTLCLAKNLSASLTVGPDGPILLQDTNLLEIMGKFAHEKQVERVVHAKGIGAHGYFELTSDLSQLTKASIFNKVGTKTRVLVRFSSTDLESGSADLIHGSKGFGIKFYTKHDGPYDLVGQNLPVTPVRDPIIAPLSYMVRKRSPITNTRNVSAYWDFVTKRPEVIFNTLLMYSPTHGYPNGFRSMNGFGVHAFKFINDQNQFVWVKFHITSNQQSQPLTPEKLTTLSGSDPDYCAHDLYDAIESRQFPSWTLQIQIMTQEQAETFSWNPFDPTKVWPIEDFPLKSIGRLILNRNPINYFGEIESASFVPSNLIPGIDLSPDPILQARVLIYPETARTRIGPFYRQLSINNEGIYSNIKKHVTILTNRDVYLRDDSVSYKVTEGDNIVGRYDNGDEDNFSQATSYWRNLTQVQKQQLVHNMVFELKKVSEHHIVKRLIENVFNAVDTRLGDMIKLELQL